MHVRSSILIGFVIAAILLSACARTRVTDIWQKKGFTGPPIQSLMILAQTGDEYSRSAWETLIADRYRQSGMNAVPVVSAFPAPGDAPLATVLNYAREKGIEGLLVVRHIDTVTEKVVHPPRVEYFYAPFYSPWYYPGYRGYYRWYPYYRYYGPYYPYADAYVSPGYTSYNRIVLVESYLYHTGSREMVWSMTTRTYNPLSSESLAADISRESFRLLRRQNLIRLTR